VEGWLERGEDVDIGFVTAVFGGLILAAATQGESGRVAKTPA
jgi:hypothetical protein